jgi:phosphatidate cytidylyltransferase
MSRPQSRSGSRRRTRPSDTGARVLAAIPAAIFAIFIVAEGGLIFALGVIALGIICLHELYTLLGEVHPAKLAGFLAIIALALAALYGDQFQLLLVLVAFVPVLFALTLLRPVRESATLSMAVTMLGVWWIGLAIAHAVLLREAPHGDGVLVDVLVGTFIGDTGAYFGGRAFGRRPLSRRISPNKTLEGLAFGFVFAIAATWFAGLYQDWLTGADALLIGLGIGLAAPVGDLFESFIKRDVATKDTGRLFGAHGGALDRLDAVLFTIPAAYYIWIALLS